MKTGIRFFVENPKLTGLLTVVTLVMGLLSLRVLTRESRPPVDFARLSIDTIYPGSSPAEVEDQITRKIEDELRGIEGIKDVRSVSQSGRSSIQIRIDMDNVDTRKVQDEIQRAVQRVKDLPTDILDTPKVTTFNAKEIPILELVLREAESEVIGQGRERDRLADALRLVLEDDPGVATVRLTGFREREFQILLDVDRMAARHVGINEIVDAVRQNTKDIPAGYIRSPGDQRLVRVTGQITEAEKLRDLIVRSNFTGQRIRIGDVGRVVDGVADPDVLVRHNGRPAVLLTVAKKADADAITVVKRLHLLMDKFKQERLPSSYQIETYNDESARVANRLEIVTSNALQGLLLVLLILLIFLPGTIGLAASMSLPIAVMATLALLPIMGANFNNITMLAMVIALGMLVDNAIVIAENYARYRSEGLPPREAAVRGAHQFWLPIFATALTTIMAFLPMLVTKGVMGQFIRWIPIVVTLALIASLLEGYFLLPMRLSYTHRRQSSDQSAAPARSKVSFSYFKSSFLGLARWCLRHRYLVFLGMNSLLVGSVLLAKFGNRFELFPKEDVEFYFASVEAPITSTLAEVDLWAKDLGTRIRDRLGPENIAAIVSRAGVMQFGPGGESQTGDHVGMLTIVIPVDRARLLNVNETLAKLRQVDKGPFRRVDFQAGGNGPPVGDPLNVTFRSQKDAELHAWVDEFKAALAQIPGVFDVKDNEVRGGPEYRVEPISDALSRLNLSTDSIGSALRTALQGTVVSELTLDGEEVEIRIRYDDSERTSLASLKRSKIMEREKRLIPLTSTASINEAEAPAVRKRYNFRRAISVSAQVDPSIITSVALNKQAIQIFEKAQSRYPDVTAVFGGENESTKESTSSLVNAMVIALFSIFAILVFMFRSFLHPVLIITTIPLGLIGVSVAFWAHGRPLGFFALIGVVGLAGVVVNSAIILVSYINEIRATRPELPFLEALGQAAADRLRPVLVTSLTTVGGLMPTAYSLGGHDSILVPMTLALAWGLLTGTLLTLIWIPVGYALIEDFSRLPERLWRKGEKKNALPPPMGEVAASQLPPPEPHSLELRG